MGHFFTKKFLELPKKTYVSVIRIEIYFKTILLSEAFLDRFRLKSLGCPLKPVLIIITELN